MQNKVEPVEDTSTAPQGLIKTPKQLMVTVVLAFVVPISVIILLVNLASYSSSMGAGSAAQTSEAIAERIQPVAGFKLVDADAPAETLSGEDVYKATCVSCHDAGVAGAPKLGDADDWAPLIDSGLDAMVKIAIEGKGAMPPRGGNSNLSDHEVTLAVIYMANEAGGSFDEPAEGDDGAATSDDADEDTADSGDATDSADDSTDEPASDNGEEAAEDAATEGDESAADNGEEADTEEATAGSETAELDPAGQKLYDSVCFTCHTAGVAGAPKIGDQSDWDPYIETGMEAMVENAIKGVGAMPPRGGSSASDEEIEAAIEYILSTLD